MSKIIKTIGPLHFEDLDPHRFEDLVRQLMYDFKDWRQLEGTGRVGSEEGFDSLGWEIVYPEERSEEEEEDYRKEDRIWLIQCKRERTITPKKIEKYLEDILLDKKGSIYGVIFVAPCDFSLKTRQAFRAKCGKVKAGECHIWGKAELEDMLFQPKNDYLLYAYFGISLTIRRRSLKTQLRSKLSMKRKAIRCLGNIGRFSVKEVLLRDPEETRYPYMGDIKNFEKYPPWKIYNFSGHYHDGLEFIIRQYYAYLADDKLHWDFIEGVGRLRSWNDPWKSKDESSFSAASQFWNDLPDNNRGWFEVIGLVPYDKILEIDDDGDIYFQGPHIYVPFSKKGGPFEHWREQLETVGSQKTWIHPEKENRIKFFPKTLAEPDKNE